MERWEQALKDLRARFVRESGERLDRIAVCLDSLQRDSADTEALAQLRLHFHGLSGLGSTYGFPKVTSIGLQGEAECGKLLSAGRGPAGAELADWRELLQSLRRQFSDADVGGARSGPPAVAAKRHDILLVDPDPQIRESLSQLGEREGFCLRAVATRQEALEEISRGLPDGVLLEAGLSDGAGYELVEHLRGLPGGESLPVLIMSGQAPFLDRVEAIHCGADGFFEKVSNGEEALMRRLRQLLERTRVESPRVLSVEDDPQQAGYLEAVLESAGYEVRVCPDPKEFEAALISFRPDLVLMDILLPNVSGYDLARYVRQDERYATLPVLFLTTEQQIPVRIEAVKAGADDHLVKPIAPGLLLSTVAARIERARFLKNLLDRDGLTRLLTHTAFLEGARAAIAARQRHPDRTLALVLLDLDHFKAVNDRYGHPVGDWVLSSLSGLLRQRLRQSDTIGRLGGEEFAVILEDLRKSEAIRLMERILHEFAALEHRAPEGGSFRVTFTAGVAMLDPATTDLNGWLETADAALYAAKAAGRNRVRAATSAATGLASFLFGRASGVRPRSA